MSTKITAQMVGDLREKTGAGLLDCKKALEEAKGDVEEAVTILRKKGAASAARKADRATREGLIESYIHVGGKVGVMIEVNCETDFVARNEEFKTFCRDLCLQIAAANPAYVRREDVSEAELAREREIASAQAQNKPPAAVQKIVEGKLEKYYSTVCLLDQPFVKLPDKTVKEILTEKVAKIGENIQIRRFVRYQLGEELRTRESASGEGPGLTQGGVKVGRRGSAAFAQSFGAPRIDSRVEARRAKTGRPRPTMAAIDVVGRHRRTERSDISHAAPSRRLATDFDTALGAYGAVMMPA